MMALRKSFIVYEYVDAAFALRYDLKLCTGVAILSAGIWVYAALKHNGLLWRAQLRVRC